MNLKFNISEPVKRNNIAIFFLSSMSSMEKNNNKYLLLFFSIELRKKMVILFLSTGSEILNFKFIVIFSFIVC